MTCPVCNAPVPRGRHYCCEACQKSAARARHNVRQQAERDAQKAALVAVRESMRIGRRYVECRTIAEADARERG